MSIGHLLTCRKIRPTFKPTEQIYNILRPSNDPQDALSEPGVNRIPGSYGSVYVGTTKVNINTLCYNINYTLFE